METTIIEEKGNELKLEIRGESRTFGNLIQHELLNDENVEYAGYDVPHPLVRSMIIYVRTIGRRSPRKALRDALVRLRSKLERFAEGFEQPGAEAI